jgi:hypothetical protein
MANPRSLIGEIKDSIQKLSNDNTPPDGSLDKIDKQVNSLISSPTPPTELSEVIYAFQSQKIYTNNTFMILNRIAQMQIPGLENLRTVIDIIQDYIDYIQPLDRILPQLIDGLDNKSQSQIISAIKTEIPKIDKVKKDISRILEKSLGEFGNKLDELALQKLVLTSGNILGELTSFSDDINAMKDIIDRLISHLTNAQEFFQTFGENDRDITGNEPNEIQQLIKNWGESVAQIETIEKNNPAIQKALDIPSNSRLAIAQSIKIHDLLEANYDYLTAIVRSIDLVSAGSL